MFVQFIDIEFIYFSSQRHSFAGPQCFAPLFSGEVRGVEFGLGQYLLAKITGKVRLVRG
jgi:hypothetical protein